AVLASWTRQLHAAGYKSGVYSSDTSGIRDLVSKHGTGYIEPDELWMANWNNQATVSDANVPRSEWANHQRLHQYKSDTETHGGVRMNIDRDYVDAATAAPGGRLSGPPESFWLYTAYGNVYTSSGANCYGSPAHRRAHEPSITGMTATPDGKGYWLVDSSGQVFAFGDAANRKMVPALPHTTAVVGIAATRTGGYWLFTR